MREAAEASRLRPIVAAIDASPQSLCALQAAAEVAALLGVDLHGIFVEDINLLHMCGLPFTCEVGSFTAGTRRLDNIGIERQLRALEATIRQAMERIGERLRIHWTFEVRRGLVVDELLAAAEAASLLSLGRAAGRQHRTALGVTAQSIVRAARRPVLVLGEHGGLRYPLVVLYTGSEAADRALRLALSLAERRQRGMVVLIWADASRASVERLERQVKNELGHLEMPVRIAVIADAADLFQRIHNGAGSTLILPNDRAHLLSQHTGPTILVP
jgi:nucleotide-binding universal stress UspA family protein